MQYGVLRLAFDLAADDDMIRRNPFLFQVVGAVPNDTVARKVLSRENQENAGMEIKSLQYLMGHSDVGPTLYIYFHSSYEIAEQAFERISSETGQQKEEMGEV